MKKEKKFKVKYDIQSVQKNVLETFNYEYPGKRIELLVTTDEFTSLCPWTGLPDFARLTIRYVPKKRCIELKSLKYYLLSYRNVGVVYEHAVNKIIEDLVEVCDPIEMHIEMELNPRGGLKTTAKISYTKRKKIKSN